MGSGVRGGSTAVMYSMRLHRRTDGSAMNGIWQRILFQEVPVGSSRDVGQWERLGVRVEEMEAGWGPLVLVSRHWADVGVTVCREPGAGLRGAMQGLGREDFIDGPLWVWRQCW